MITTNIHGKDLENATIKLLCFENINFLTQVFGDAQNLLCGYFFIQRENLCPSDKVRNRCLLFYYMASAKGPDFHHILEI